MSEDVVPEPVVSGYSAENDVLREALADAITGYLVCYTLPANYANPLGDQTHEDVARRCGPLIADHLMQNVIPSAKSQEVTP